MTPRLSFSGCDYLGLAKHPSVLGALRKSVDPEITQGARVSISASRFTTGNHSLYLDLEHALSGFFGRPRAFLMPSGYTAVIAAIHGIAHGFSTILIDEGCHSSTIDALRFADSCRVPFRHLSVAAVQRIVKKSPPDSRVLLITDGLFGTTGDIAPIADYLNVCPRQAGC